MKVFISLKVAYEYELLKVAYEYELDSLQINDICMRYRILSMISIKFPSFFGDIVPRGGRLMIITYSKINMVYTSAQKFGSLLLGSSLP
jgi:hypothetical protein